VEVRERHHACALKWCLGSRDSGQQALGQPASHRRVRVHGRFAREKQTERIPPYCRQEFGGSGANLSRRKASSDECRGNRPSRRPGDRFEPAARLENCLQRSGIRDALCAPALKDAAPRFIDARIVEPPPLDGTFRPTEIDPRQGAILCARRPGAKGLRRGSNPDPLRFKPIAR
jgi:hypothetical protein